MRNFIIKNTINLIQIQISPLKSKSSNLQDYFYLLFESMVEFLTIENLGYISVNSLSNF